MNVAHVGLSDTRASRYPRYRVHNDLWDTWYVPVAHRSARNVVGWTLRRNQRTNLHPSASRRVNGMFESQHGKKQRP